MTSNQQTGTFTVPVGTRLSHGVELELLVAYLYTSDIDPDEQHSTNLAPILRVNNRRIDDAEAAVREHIRWTLRDHGIRVSSETPEFNVDVPLHLDSLDQWSVDVDPTASHGLEESELVRGKPGRYRWLGLELRSPAYWDVPHVYDEIRFVVNLVKSRYRVRVNHSCGFHVHVGNGPQYFDAKTLKRAGAFLFAVDPLLSRLHAPWRRVGEYSTSIRYRSRLARWDGMRPADAQGLVDHDAERAREIALGGDALNPILVVPWSDTSIERASFGGTRRWEQYVNGRLQNGPFMTLNESPPSPEGSQISSSASSETSRSPSPPPSPSPSPPPPPSSSVPSFSLPSSPPSSDDDDDDTDGGAYGRRFQEFINSDKLRARSLEIFELPPKRLTEEEQYHLLTIVICERLFGHTDLEDLSNSQFQRLVTTIAPFIEIARHSFDWDSNANDFTFRQGRIGDTLHHPRPLRLNELNAPDILRDMEAQIDDGEVNIELFDDEEEDDIVIPLDQIERSTRDVIDELKEQPTFPARFLPGLMKYFEDMAAAARRNQKYFDRARPTPTTNTGGGANPPAGNGKSGSNSPADANASGPRNDGFGLAFPQPSLSAFGNGRSPPRSGGDDSSSSSDDSSEGGFDDSLNNSPNDSDDNNDMDSFDSGSDYNPPAFRAFPGVPIPPPQGDASDSTDSPVSSPFRENRSSTTQNNNTKLQPHDFTQRSNAYITGVSGKANLTFAHWEQISWLPYLGGPPDPREPHPRFGPECPGPDCRSHAVTGTRAGLSTILGVESAAALAMLLVSEPEDSDYIPRLNYNFAAYASYTLNSGMRSGEKRTIEFREAGGSLDPEWIILWDKICVGIMRFCRDASVSEFLTVLEKVIREEERQRTGGKQVRYDVCDLLEDICLFTEATIIRRRERETGPPM
ncbi:hypothetical protein E0Z10_g4759 [Xylaria hypoxylon]|uniref:Amidoligase enzyme n=1 Tax=Xylaria hypoxylon TaxID=37992 RepID=A0A4Z0YKA2_9PEZI|nr:hypothetical protein E0Z10_g4759 [Xylaria hypoxylon]